MMLLVGFLGLRSHCSANKSCDHHEALLKHHFHKCSFSSDTEPGYENKMSSNFLQQWLHAARLLNSEYLHSCLLQFERTEYTPLPTLECLSIFKWRGGASAVPHRLAMKRGIILTKAVITLHTQLRSYSLYGIWNSCFTTTTTTTKARPLEWIHRRIHCSATLSPQLSCPSASEEMSLIKTVPKNLVRTRSSKVFMHFVKEHQHPKRLHISFRKVPSAVLATFCQK